MHEGPIVWASRTEYYGSLGTPLVQKFYPMDSVQVEEAICPQYLPKEEARADKGPRYDLSPSYGHFGGATADVAGRVSSSSHWKI